MTVAHSLYTFMFVKTPAEHAETLLLNLSYCRYLSTSMMITLQDIVLSLPFKFELTSIDLYIVLHGFVIIYNHQSLY